MEVYGSMSPDFSPELDETFKSLDQAIEEFRQIKDKLRTGSVEEVAAKALPVESETTA